MPESETVAPATDRRLLRAAVGHGLIALLAFALCAAGLDVLIDHLHVRPEVPEPFKTKIDFCLDGRSYDTAFVGSSRFFHGLDPAAFDAETARLGTPTRSFNLGFDAMDFAELRFVVQHLLADPRQKLKNLVIEPSLRLRLAPGLERSQRAVTLHDLQGTEYVTEFIFRGSHDARRKLFWLGEQSAVSAVRLTNVGALSNAYIRPQEPPVDPRDLTGPAGDGFVPLDPAKKTDAAVTADGIRQVVADHPARSLNGFEIDQLVQLKTLAAGHGVRLILLAPPTATADIFAEFTAADRAVADGRLDLPMMDFASPVAYPDLYDPAGFTDPDHVGGPVARRMTRHAADLFHDLTEAGHAVH